MVMPRFAGRRDKNDGELAQLAQRIGGKLVKIGPLDYWLGIRGRWFPVEIKDPAREGHANEYTKDQREFMADCHARQLPVLIWRTSDDVLSDFAKLRT
jgi:hypothetical protein